MAWYTPFTTALSNMGTWMKANPEATQLLGGLAAGVADGYFKEKEMKESRKRWDEESKRYENKPSDSSDAYGSHVKAIAGGTGLLSQYKPINYG